MDELAESNRRLREAQAAERKEAADNALKDQFAAAALTGILACYRDYRGGETCGTRVALAWDYADQMMKERAGRRAKAGGEK